MVEGCERPFDSHSTREEKQIAKKVVKTKVKNSHLR